MQIINIFRQRNKFQNFQSSNFSRWFYIVSHLTLQMILVQAALFLYHFIFKKIIFCAE